MSTIFDEFQMGSITLSNRIVMAPLTRCRAVGNIPNDMMAQHYADRASIGLIIAEGTSPSPNGTGYNRIPALYSQEQIEGWKKISKAVHEKGGKIFIQIMHCGRISHPENLGEGGEVVAPSAIAHDGQMSTPSGKYDLPVPKAMSIDEIKATVEEYAQAAENAITAGCDGVEIHGANGYLVNQFISPMSNQRDDEYGGSIENRNRFAIEVAAAIVDRIGGDKTGIRLSPYGVYSGMGEFDGIDEQYTQLASEFGKLGLAYIHLVDHSAMGAPEVPMRIKMGIKNAFGGVMIASGGLDKAKAIAAIENGIGDLVAFGRPVISNPDFVYKLQNDIELTPPNPETFYSEGEPGYNDYPNVE